MKYQPRTALRLATSAGRGRTRVMRALPLRLVSLVLLLAAGLVALTVFFAPGPQPASGQMTDVEVWSATLTVADLPGEHGDGCDSYLSQEELHCVPGQLLTSNSFKYMGKEDDIVGVRVLYGNLRLTFYEPIEELDLKTLTLHVDGQAYPLSDAKVRAHASATVYSAAVWLNTGLSWSPGDTVNLKLTTSLCDITQEVNDEEITITWHPKRTQAGSVWLYRNLVQGEYGFARADMDEAEITASAPFVWIAGGFHSNAPTPPGESDPRHDSLADGASREGVIKYVRDNAQDYSEPKWYVREPDESTTSGLTPSRAINILGAGGEERVTVQAVLWGSETCSNGGPYAIPFTRQTEPIPGGL